ncbi:hypothetical protein LTR36_008525 [Oleoguttula mirabilis]|uniref:Conserved oligomeric Golgi complex subunit 4 n=1 Tax=Oleoguttula mirabilis TaxID=1507867 RepID=A0AAV9JUQ8_9PEZI|nr:hypothetical protein LTR36_008525 [Oleoguttula mirabilis]
MSLPLNGNGNGSVNITPTNIYTATSVTQLRAALAELGTREATITVRLDTLLSTQKDVSRQLARLDLARAQLGSQVIATRGISHGMLSSAAATAHRISGAVKRLDREQAAVKATLDVVEQVAELKACVLGVHGSMGAPQDWEMAAGYLHRASRVPDAVIDGAFAEEIVPTAEVPDTPRQTLDAAAESLCGLFVREFEKAAREGDGARVTRFFKLFPLIGRSDVGLDAYGRYVCTGIATRARGNMSSTQRREGLFYANALTKLFEHIAQIVDGHEALVERHYGVGSMTKVIERIQVEADVQGGIILDTWAEERRVGRKLTEVKSYPFNFLVQSFLPSQKTAAAAAAAAAGLASSRSGSPAPGSGRTSEDEGVDMKEVDALLNESAVMLSRWALYTRFLATKTSATATASDEEANSTLTLPLFLTHSTLHQKVTDHLTTPFATLATFFTRRSVEKAFQLDEPPSGLHLDYKRPLTSTHPPPYITSAVDDVMYIISQILQRTLSTSQRSVVASVVPAVGRVLGSDFFGMLQRKMRDESYPKAAIQGAMPPEGVIVQFLVLVNNLDVATEYLRRIVRTSLGEQEASGSGSSSSSSSIRDAFPFGHEAVFVETALRGLEAGFTGKTTELVQEAVEVMVKQVMRHRLRPVLGEAFRDVDYSSTGDGADGEREGGRGGHDDEQQHEEAGPEDLVAQRFARGWHLFTLPLKRLLTERNYARLHTATLLHLARVLEKRILALAHHGQHVTPLGAVRLERDIAGIVAAACKGGGRHEYEARGLFARCVQMCLVVCMEADEWEEVEGLGGDVGEVERVSGVRWVLDAGERGRVRGILRGG